MTRRGDRLEAKFLPEQGTVLVDVFADGEFLIQLTLPWSAAMDAGLDLLTTARHVQKYLPLEPPGP